MSGCGKKLWNSGGDALFIRVRETCLFLCRAGQFLLLPYQSIPVPEAVFVPVGVNRHQGRDGSGIVFADQGAFLGEAVQTAGQGDRLRHFVRNGPFQAPFPRMAILHRTTSKFLRDAFIPAYLHVARKGGPARPAPAGGIVQDKITWRSIGRPF